jgi:uncharacterized glyoxalase superfamily protein PhnB
MLILIDEGGGRFAMFRDRFGTPWMINCEKPA